MARRFWLIAIGLLIASHGAAQVRPANQDIGTWVLSCSTMHAEPCQLRHRAAVGPAGAGAASAALEVMHRGGAFIPVVALRGLTTQAAVGGLLAVQANVSLRFDNAPQVPLTCRLDGSAIVCAPEGDAAKDTAAELPTAHSVLIRVRLAPAVGVTLPEQSHSFDLQGTTDALAQFRATAPANESIPVVAGLDWFGFLDRLARDAGFHNGLADVMPGATALLR